jgi:hypothetical protein
MSKPNHPSRFELEISAKVSEWDKAGKDLVPSFITSEIVKSHERGGLARANEDTEFFLHYTYKAARKDVGSFITKNYEEANTPEATFAGFDYVQRRYVVRRGGEDVGVEVHMLTKEERVAQVQFLRRRGRACLAHADELERFFILCDQTENSSATTG